MDEENPDLSGLEDICPGISKRAKDNNKDFWSFLVGYNNNNNNNNN